MKKGLLYIIFFFSFILSSCGVEQSQIDAEETKSLIEFQNADVQDVIGSTNIGDSTGETNNIADSEPLVDSRVFLEEKIVALETLDWTELTCYADEETSLLNSNLLLNYGHLTYDEKGQIYFTDMNEGGIYVCDGNGENKRLLSEDNAGGLQIAGEWLYYNCFEGILKRIHCDTGVVEIIRNEPCGEFVVWKDRLYTNGPEGFCVAEPDGSNKEILRDQELPMIPQQIAGENFWIGNAANGADGEWFMKGYLLGYDEVQDKKYFLSEGANFPLLAGNWLSVFDNATGTRRVWDLENDIDIDLGVWDQRSVSDGKTLYYNSNHGTCSIFYRLIGENAEELFRIETEASYMAVEYKYLSPKALYWLQKSLVNGAEIWELCYYNIETGEIGKIY